MATVTHRLGSFTGHVGPVRFVRGVADTDDADMLAFFAGDPDTYDVDTSDVPSPEQVEGDVTALLQEGSDGEGVRGRD